jgi:ADP-heptose:LPS heptosyltransferase
MVEAPTVTDRKESSVLVFHAGALGDFVLTWPLLRALQSRYSVVSTVAADSHARLAARFLGVRPISAERREVTSLWQEVSAAKIASAWHNLLRSDVPNAIVSFLADEHSDAGRRWIANAEHIAVAGEVLCIGPPGSSSRASALERFEVGARGRTSARVLDPSRRPGPLIVHVGAGSRDKMWPLDRWCSFVDRLRDDGRSVSLIAGQVEHDLLDAHARHTFELRGGRMLDSLDALADVLLSAAAYVGADTGPTHLAAQLGTPTLALFGPTDPTVWAPVGPSVRVLAPLSPAPMTWLTPEDVRLGLNNLLCEPPA